MGAPPTNSSLVCGAAVSQGLGDEQLPCMLCRKYTAFIRILRTDTHGGDDTRNVGRPRRAVLGME